MKLKIVGLLILLVISLVVAPQFGASFIPVWDMYQAFTSPVPTDEMKMLSTIVQDIRLPRLLYSVLTGIGLSLVGVLMQTVTRNALADPYVLGVSSGASTGAVFAIIMGGLPFLASYNVPFFAALGAGISILLVLLCVGRSQKSSEINFNRYGYDRYFLIHYDDDYLWSEARSTSTKCYVLVAR